MRSRQYSRDKGGINGLVEQENIAEQQGEKGGENGPGTWTSAFFSQTYTVEIWEREIINLGVDGEAARKKNVGWKECKAGWGSEDLLTMNEPPCHILKQIVMFPISSIFHVFITSKL